MKNPFPKIGKIIKYEFKHSSKILMPMYGVLLILGLLTGLSSSQKMNQIMNSIEQNMSYEYRVEGADAAKDMIFVLLIIAVIALSVAITVLTIVTIARRFKQSMLGDEAYLNLSLPVTMGQQLWGRFIADLIFMIICALVIALTVILCFIRMNIFSEISNFFSNFNQSLTNQNLSMAKIILLSLLMSFSSSAWIISLIFVVNAISHLLKNHKNVIKLVSVVVLLWINTRVIGFASLHSSDFSNIFTRNTLISSAILIAFSAIYFAFTQFVFTKKLNLE